MKNLKKVSETVKKSPAAKIAAGKKAALAKRAGTVSAKGVSAKTNRSTTMATKKPTPKKTATPKSDTGTIDREQLLTLGEELNKLLFEGSEVEYEEMDDEALEAQIRQDCTEIDPKDAFTDEAKAIIAELDIDIEWAVAKKPAAKAAPAKTEKAAKVEKPAAAKKAGPKKAGGEGKPGVIATIIDLLKKGPITKADILAELVKTFPDREEKAMKSTINIQVPGRIIKDKGLDVVEVKDKGWKIKK